MDNIIVEAIRTKGQLFCKTGIRNAYRDAFLKGYGASCKEKSWDKEKHQHLCCGSKVSWRHKSNCSGFEGNDKWKALGE